MLKNLYRFLGAALVVLLLLLGNPGQLSEPVPPYADVGDTGNEELILEAAGAILVDSGKGEVLFARNAHLRFYPASTTKIVTALVALNYGSLEDVVTVGEEVKRVAPGSSLAGLEPGDRLTLGDLLRAMLLPSGNDAAYAMAVYIARQERGDPALGIDESLSRFGQLMNRQARRAGAYESHFVNPDGIHDPEHYSTPYDLALLAVKALEHDFIRETVASPGLVVELNRGGSPSLLDLRNTNELLQADSPYYRDWINGIKTGHTSQAGYCLIASARDSGRNLVSVVLGSSEEGRWRDTLKLLEQERQAPATPSGRT